MLAFLIKKALSKWSNSALAIIKLVPYNIASLPFYSYAINSIVALILSST